MYGIYHLHLVEFMGELAKVMHIVSIWYVGIAFCFSQFSYDTAHSSEIRRSQVEMEYIGEKQLK